jgi:hypothetical protein
VADGDAKSIPRSIPRLIPTESQNGPKEGKDLPHSENQFQCGEQEIDRKIQVSE